MRVAQGLRGEDSGENLWSPPHRLVGKEGCGHGVESTKVAAGVEDAACHSLLPISWTSGSPTDVGLHVHSLL